MKISRKKDIYFIILFVVIVSCCFLYLFQTSYAKYRREVSGNVTADIASWNIKVNNEDIANKKALTSDIELSFKNSSTHDEGTIAPGVSGTYRIVIDASDVDVNFDVVIRSEVSPLSSIPDLKTTKWTPKDVESINYGFTYVPETGITKKINKNTEKAAFELTVMWDDENGTMDNQADTLVALDENSKALMTVTIHFSQST